ncbi:hypothetical protein HRI_001738900 [Hibiscus trionum]|uniref:Reverse transcriptase domain-containing protein n=1 Tax=Hibiscus trionum TaxID=183268 RepID=A0A9W7HPA6_HIBTR|nr:hypothetical protein HRI_001738900 [Hibiscus trionum]
MAGATPQEPTPDWKQETSRIEAHVQRLETSMNTRFQEMQTAMMANLHKLLEIGLGKKIDTSAIAGQHSGILGASPENPQAGTIPIPDSGAASGLETGGEVELEVRELIRETQEREPVQQMNFAYKLLCPRFDGLDFREWMCKLEQYFEAEGVPDFAKVRVVMLHLEGKALQWHQFLSKSHPDLNSMSWQNYVQLLRERFAPGGFDGPFSDLIELRQTDTVDKYYEDFIHLLNQISKLPNAYTLSVFKNHLRLEIGQIVKLLQPKTLLEAFHLAKHVESMYYPTQKRNPGFIQKPFSTLPSILSSPSRASGSVFRGPAPTGSTTIAPSSRFSTLRSTSPVHLKPNVSNQRGSGKTLSAAEVEERRKKGLCFWCAAKYKPGHKCAKSQMYQIIVDGVEEEGDTEIFLDCEEVVEQGVPDNAHSEEPVLSLHAMWGTAKWDTMRLQVQIGRVGCVALIDTGSTHNFISLALVKQLSLRMSRHKQLKVTVADGNWMNTLGECSRVEWRSQGVTFISDFLVLPIKNCEIVLGIQWLAQLGNIQWDFSKLCMQFGYKGKEVKFQGCVSQALQVVGSKKCDKLLRGTKGPYTASVWILDAQLELKTEGRMLEPDVETLLQEFTLVFEEPVGLPPERGHDHKIELKDDKAMVKIKPYRHSTHQKDEIEKLVSEMLQSGIIRDSNSVFSSPIVMVKKKDGSWRMCVDYRKLNQLTVKDSFPMPVIEELLDELGAANVFSKLDLRSGYHQIRMRESDIPKTAFRTHEGHYEFLVMPFGLTNAPATFQGLMNKLFKQHLRKFVLVFFDDILVYSVDWASHLEHLRTVLEILKTHQLYAKRSKCCFGAKEVDYLGYVISGGCISMDESKVRSIYAWPTPTTVKELRGFLGLSGYYRRFVKGYGCLARPLTDLLKKGAWKWGMEEEEAFGKLKKAVCSAPVLALPDFNSVFIVEADASDVGVGAVLVQKGGPLAFFSKGLEVRHRGLSVYEKEMLAVLMAVKRWSSYLIGRHFIIKTDHHSLRFLAENQAFTPFQQKWVVKMMGFDYEIQYRKGIHNVVADALSRRPEEGSCCTMVVSQVDAKLWERIMETWKKDDKLRKIIETKEKEVDKHPKYQWDGKLLKMKGKLVVGDDTELKKELLKFFHDSAVGGHSGATATIQRVSTVLY